MIYASSRLDLETIAHSPRRLSVLTDMNFEFMQPDPNLFPNIPSDIQVHSGFAFEHEKTAGQILAEVKRLMTKHSSTEVILVSFFTSCHPLGCLSDSIYIPLCRLVTRS